jgi:error-prone DNA polymerase
LGLEYVRTIGKELAEKIAAGRPYRDMEHVVRANNLSTDQVEALATAGAFGCFDLDRRGALWSAGAVAQSRPGRLAGIVTGELAPDLPPMDELEETVADLWATGISPERSPMDFVRPWLDERGAVTAAGLVDVDHGRRATVGGIVTHRQRPATAQGVTFINLEDETGLINVICSKGVWARYRRVARSAGALLVRGRVEKVEGVINVVAEKIEALPLGVAVKSRDFR